MIAKLLRLLKAEKGCQQLRPVNLDVLHSELIAWNTEDVTLVTKTANLFVDLEEERFKKIALMHTFWETNADKLCPRERERFLKLMTCIKENYSSEAWMMREWAFGRIEKV